MTPAELDKAFRRRDGRTNDVDMQSLLTCVFKVCARYRGSVTSWIRTAEHNQAVHGEVSSHHIGGRACDVIYDQGPPSEQEVRALADSFSVRLVREATHDHFQV